MYSFSLNRNYSPLPGPAGSANKYRKYVGVKMQYEKRALENTYKSAMNTINKNMTFSTPSHKTSASRTVCLKSAPIQSDSESDIFLDDFVYISPSPSSNTRSKLDYSVNCTPTRTSNQSFSLQQQIMKYFNVFDSSLQSLQNEISEMKSMIASNSMHTIK